MKIKTTVLLTVLAGAGIALVGCGQQDKTSATAPTVSQPDDGVRTIEITGNDTMQFNLKELRAKPGEKLRIAFANIGRMPKQAMAHNWVLLKPMSDSELNAFGMAASSRAPEYLPADKSAVLAYTKILGPGERDQIEITVPAEPGDYPFVCTFPGHFALMKGKLIVQ